MLDLWLLRHAESWGNADGTDADRRLTPKGSEQAAALATRFEECKFDRALCSPLARARETAALALPGVDVIIDPSLRELESSRAPTWVDVADLAAVAQLLRSPPAPVESGPEFMQRISGWIASLPTTGSVLAVTHFAVVREILGTIVGFARAPQAIAFTGLFRLTVNGAASEIHLWNDTSHLGFRA